MVRTKSTNMLTAALLAVHLTELRGCQLNLSLTKPLYADDSLDNLSVADLDGAHAANPRKIAMLEETAKQKVRRLAAHCQLYRGPVMRLAIVQL